jgi:hypothetical protein
MDPSSHPPTVESVEYILDAPTEEDLIESFPVHLVSENMARLLTTAGLEGFALGEATVVPSREYVEVYGDAPHKDYRWLRVRPSPRPDCWLDDESRLCVSDRMMGVLSRGVLDGCDVTKRP